MTDPRYFFMVLPVILSLITFVIMIFSILFFPKIKIFKFEIDTYWIVTLIGAVAVLAFSATKPETVGKALIADTAINPLKILVLFISMTILSIFLECFCFSLSYTPVILNFVGFSGLAGHAPNNAAKIEAYLFSLSLGVFVIFTKIELLASPDCTNCRLFIQHNSSPFLC